jgi:hypothetical protein
MKMKNRTWASILAAVMTLSAGCKSAYSPGAGKSLGLPGTITVSLNRPSKTVVPDWSTSISSYDVTLTSHDGYAELKAAVVGSSGQASFNSVNPGTWDIDVDALNGTTVVGTGSRMGIVLSPGAALSLTVPISGSQTQNGTGNFNFTFAFPSSTSIDCVVGQLFNTSAWTAVGSPIILNSFSTSGPNLVATLAQSGLPSGNYTLELTFKRNGQNGTVAGVYGEAINIYDNATSDQWLDSSGILNSQRTFAVADFNTTDSNLSNLQVAISGPETLVLNPGFSSNVFSYAVYAGPNSVDIIPTQSLAGQRIQYQVNGAGPWIDLGSGVASPNLGSSGTVLSIKVTANDISSTSIYTITVSPELTVSYDPNGGAGSVPSPTSFLQGYSSRLASVPPSLTRSNFVLNAYYWNSAPDGSGTSYIADGSYSLSANLTLYVVWIPIYHIHYDPNSSSLSGNVPTDSGSYRTGEAATILDNTGGLAVAGSNFAGWNTAADGSGTTYAAGCEIFFTTSDLTLYAIWLPSAYSFTNPTGTSAQPNNLTVTGCSPKPSGAMTIPGGVTTLGPDLFQGDTGLSSVSLPSGLISIGSSAFCDTGLTAVTIPDTVLWINPGAFEQTALTSVHIPAKVTYVGDGAFSECPNLSSITVDPNNPSFEVLSGALCWKVASDDTELIAVPGTATSPYTIPSGVTDIISNTFLLSTLTQIVIPSGVTRIEGQAFMYSGLTSVYIPATVTYSDPNAFDDCMNLSGFTVDDSSATYKAIGGVLFNKAGTELVEAPGGMSGSYIIPSGVLTIDGESFSNIYFLTSVTIPESVTAIGSQAFTNVSPYFVSVHMLGAAPPSLPAALYAFPSSNFKIYVPMAALTTYSTASNWSTFYNNGQIIGE